MGKMTPEEQARTNIDWMLTRSTSTRDGGSRREFRLKSGHGHADYLLNVDRAAAGVVEAKPGGYTLKGVEAQSGSTARASRRTCRFTSGLCPSSTRARGLRPSLPMSWTRNRAAALCSPSICRLSGPIPAELGSLDVSKTKVLESLAVRWPKNPPANKHQAAAYLPMRRLL